MNNVGMNVKIRRLESGMTQKDLADLVGVTRGMIAQIERGFKAPPLAIAIMIADVLHTTVDDLTRSPQ